MQLARRVIAKAGEQADCLHCCKAAHQAAHRAEYTLCGAVVAIIRIMRVANEAAVAGAVGVIAGEGADLAVELADSSADQRDFCGEAEVIDDQPRSEIIAAVDHYVDIFQDFG